LRLDFIALSPIPPEFPQLVQVVLDPEADCFRQLIVIHNPSQRHNRLAQLSLIVLAVSQP
jgi:hypothetical protein